jgi:hypothetical protein
MALLMYDDVRRSGNPRDTVLEFVESAFAMLAARGLSYQHCERLL